MKVIIYSTKTCASCKMVKKFLDSRKIEWVEVELDDKPELHQKLIEETGYMTVPIVQYGSVKLVGYNPSKLAALVGA